MNKWTHFHLGGLCSCMINHTKNNCGNIGVSTLHLELECTLFSTDFAHYTLSGQEYFIKICMA